MSTPAGIDASAAIRTSHEILIHAPLSRVWDIQTDIEEWPSWQSPVLTATRLDDGPLAAGSQFRWTTPVPESEFTPADTLVIVSTVLAVEHHRRLLWSGPGVGEFIRIDEGVHLWTFTEVGGGTLVHTEESWTGELVESDVAGSTAALAAGLEAWLGELKATAERSAS